MRKIFERQDLVDLAAELGVRSDWHEPDEQDITAVVEGSQFDNAMGPGHWWGQGEDRTAELYVNICRREYADNGEYIGPGEIIAQVSLATLFAWASQTVQSETTDPAIRRAVRFEALNDAVIALQRMRDV